MITISKYDNINHIAVQFSLCNDLVRRIEYIKKIFLKKVCTSKKFGAYFTLRIYKRLFLFQFFFCLRLIKVIIQYEKLKTASFILFPNFSRRNGFSTKKKKKKFIPYNFKNQN
jgi:hypothetical protein